MEPAGVVLELGPGGVEADLEGRLRVLEVEPLGPAADEEILTLVCLFSMIFIYCCLDVVGRQIPGTTSPWVSVGRHVLL